MKNFNYKILLGFAIILVLLLFFSYTSPVHRWGDASTYYMQIDSIAHDLDIKYELKDIERVLGAGFDDAPAGLHLVKNSESELYYGKEFTYSFFASPFYWFLGVNGILVFNAIMFFLMVVMGYFYLRFYNPRTVSFLVASLFFLLSTSYVYVYWIHAEIYNLFLITAGFFFWFIYIRSAEAAEHYKLYLYISVIIFGLATFAKTPNFVGILPVTIYEIYFRRFKNVFAIITLFVMPTVIFYLIYYIVSGNINPYDLQYYYCDSTGYPFVDGNDYTCGYRMPIGESVLKSSILSVMGFYTIIYSFFYYLFGRFTGVVWYYPFSLFSLYFIIATIWKHRISSDKLFNIDLARLLILGATVLNAIIYFYLSYDNPHLNYFGGGHAIGNRYFYFYPAFLFFISKLEFNKKTLSVFGIVIIIAISFVGPLILTPIETSAAPMAHTNHPPYNSLPLEYVLIEDLPLWGPNPVQFNENKLYFPLSNIRIDDASLIIEHDYPELLLMSPKRSFINLGILNPASAKTVTLISGKYKKDIIFNASGTKYVDLQVEPVFKLSDEKYLYKLEVYVTPINSSNDQIILSFLPFISNRADLLSGWHGLENWGGIPTRWMSDEATIMICLDTNQTAELGLQALSFYRPRSLDIYINDILCTRTKLSSSRFQSIIIPIQLNETNIIQFHVPEGCERPCNIKEFKSEDRRCLSIAVQNITITPIGGDLISK